MTLEIFTFCDSAYESNGSMTILKVSDGVFSDGFPLRIAKCSIVYRIRFEGSEFEKHKINLSIFNSDGVLMIPPFNEEIMPVKPLKFSTSTATGIIDLKGLILPAFGEYSLNLFLDGNLLVPCLIKHLTNA